MKFHPPLPGGSGGTRLNHPTKSHPLRFKRTYVKSVRKETGVRSSFKNPFDCLIVCFAALCCNTTRWSLQLLRLKRSVAAQMYVCKVKSCTLCWNIRPKFARMSWAYYVVRTILGWRRFQQNTRVTSSIFNLVWHSKTVRLDRWFHDWGKR